MSLQIEYIPISEITPYSKNPRKNDKAIDIVAKSIKEFGFKNPIILDKENTIVAGHTRLKAAEKLGLKEVPVIWADDLTDEQVKAYRIMDNKSVEYAQWDIDLLKDELLGLKNTGFDLDLTGFSEVELNKFLPDNIEEDFEIPKEPKYKINKGDIYQLGNHRLMCGDCTIKENVDKLMNGQKADLLLTDPPYGINIVHGSRVGTTSELGFVGIAEKHKSSPQQARIYRNIINDDKPFNPSHLLQYGKYKLIFGANHFASKLPDSPVWLVWDKKKEGGLDHNNFSDVELIWTNSDKKASLIYRHLWSGLLRVGERDIELRERVHPTQKPVGLLIQMTSDFSKTGDNVLDLYGGSGSTLIACEQTNRKCFMMELDEYYCSVIIERWEKLTNKKAIKLIDVTNGNT